MWATIFPCEPPYPHVGPFIHLCAITFPCEPPDPLVSSYNHLWITKYPCGLSYAPCGPPHLLMSHLITLWAMVPPYVAPYTLVTLHHFTWKTTAFPCYTTLFLCKQSHPLEFASHPRVNHHIHSDEPTITSAWEPHPPGSHTTSCEPPFLLWATHPPVSHPSACVPLILLWATHPPVSPKPPLHYHKLLM